MTLGSIFSKLSGVHISSILKWYAVAVMLTVALFIAGFFAWAIAAIIWTVVTSIPWWGTLVLIVIITGFACAKVYENDLFPKDKTWEDYQRSIILHGTEYKAPVAAKESPYNFSTPTVDDSWIQVHNMILGMLPGKTCDITLNGETFHFDNQTDAILFYNEVYGARKTE